MATVSIIMPTYNGSAHLRATIDSALSQAGVDLELIVVDDNSTDDSAAVAAGYGDPRVRIERNAANLGAQGNWNKALSLARGTYVKLLPQDDILLPGSLAEQVAVLEADPDARIALTFGARDIIDAAGRRIATRRLKGVRTGRIAAADLARWCVRQGTNVIGEPGAVLFRRALAERVGSFDATQPYVIDLDYWLRLLAHGDAWYSDRPVASFRVSAGSWSVAIGTRQSSQYRAFLKRMRAARLVPATGLDMLIGRLAAWANNVGRLMFYKLLVR